MKLTRENIYINLQGKSKEELIDLYEFLSSIGENIYRRLDIFLDYSEHPKPSCYLSFSSNQNQMTWNNSEFTNKQEVTIQQLKEILQPMEGFRPIAMKCTQEQFEAIKPKLKGCDIKVETYFDESLLTNNLQGGINCIGFVVSSSVFMKERTIYEEWNEEIFLKSCGIEVELSLTEKLEKAEAEVKRLKEAIEESRIKIGDWVVSSLNDCIFRYQYGRLEDDLTKITDQELINKLNELIK